MGYVVQVEPEGLAAGARRLAAAAETLDTVAGRVLLLCGAASRAAGAEGLAAALDGVGRDTGRAVAHGSSAVAALGARTALAGQDYLLLEQALTGSWAARKGLATPMGTEGPAPGGPG